MVIRMRHTRAHTANRRSHHALKAENLSTCAHCGAKHRPHHMCLQCGYYNGRQVMDLTSLKAKRDARMKAKKEQIRADLGTTGETAVAHHDHDHKEVKSETKKKEVVKNEQTKRPVRRRESKG